MEKIRKSNECHRDKQIAKKANHVSNLQRDEAKSKKEKTIQNNNTGEAEHIRGDGIVTGIEGDPEDDMDLLDYEDDLSIENDNDIAVITDCEESGKGETTDASEGPSTSTGSTHFNQMLANQSDDQLMSNPVLQRMMKQFFEKQLKNLQNDKTGKEHNESENPVKVHSVRSDKNNMGGRVIKSPLESTLYVPAIERKQMNMTAIVGQGPIIQGNHETVSRVPEICNEANLNLIDEFVENVRIQQHPEDVVVTQQERDRNLGGDDVERRKSDVSALGLWEAQEKAERTVLEAEKFHAAVETPPGTVCKLFSDNGNIKNGIVDIGRGVSDDDFFHLTCHIEPSLIHRIEKGEFVELEKLLPKDKFNRTEEGRMEWVHRDGGTFLVPAQRDTKISGFRRWEQAFGAYATIYCWANHHRAKEIWQYITVINTAASSY